jgi:hypothetical protein
MPQVTYMYYSVHLHWLWLQSCVARLLTLAYRIPKWVIEGDLEEICSMVYLAHLPNFLLKLFVRGCTLYSGGHF